MTGAALCRLAPVREIRGAPPVPGRDAIRGPWLVAALALGVAGWGFLAWAAWAVWQMISVLTELATAVGGAL